MQKSLSILLVFVIWTTTVSALTKTQRADTGGNGFFQMIFPMASKNNADYQWGKGALVVKNSNYLAEFNWAPGNGQTNSFSLVQAYTKISLDVYQIWLGKVLTGIGMLDYYSVLPPMGLPDTELGGLGVVVHVPLETMSLNVGQFGNVSADTASSSSTRVFFCQAIINLSKTVQFDVGGYMDTVPGSTTSPHLSAQLALHPDPNLYINGLFRLKPNILSLSLKSVQDERLDYYGSVSMGLNDPGKESVSSDLIVGASLAITPVTRLHLEYQSAQDEAKPTRHERNAIAMGVTMRLNTNVSNGSVVGGKAAGEARQ